MLDHATSRGCLVLKSTSCKGCKSNLAITLSEEFPCRPSHSFPCRLRHPRHHSAPIIAASTTPTAVTAATIIGTFELLFVEFVAVREVDVVEEDGVGMFVFVIEIEGAGELDVVAEPAREVDVVEEDGVGTFVSEIVFDFFVIELYVVAELAGLSPLAAMAEVMLKLLLG